MPPATFKVTFYVPGGVGRLIEVVDATILNPISTGINRLAFEITTRRLHLGCVYVDFGEIPLER